MPRKSSRSLLTERATGAKKIKRSLQRLKMKRQQKERIRERHWDARCQILQNLGRRGERLSISAVSGCCWATHIILLSILIPSCNSFSEAWHTRFRNTSALAICLLFYATV